VLTSADFGTSSLVKGKLVWNVTGSLLGIINASYNLGAILAVPVVPWVAQKVGRRWSIFIGSTFQCVGAVLQAFAQDSEFPPLYVTDDSTDKIPKLLCTSSLEWSLGLELSFALSQGLPCWENSLTPKNARS